MLRKFKIAVEGKEYLVEMEEIGGVPQAVAPVAPVAPAAPAPSAPAPTTEAAPAPAPSGEKGEGIEISAPMPGTVLKVNVKVGDQVSENQSLLILEAMKMENEIVSPINGKVTSIMVTNGQAVNVSEVLITIQG